MLRLKHVTKTLKNKLQKASVINLELISGGQNERELYLTGSNLLEQSRNVVPVAMVGRKRQGISREIDQLETL